ncbi:MAG: hypothetical protein Q4D53_06075 [Leptotrichiaceae bacterium]|nr:hypothetical protein [Leptotrichiaceae bacterium]
MEQLKKELSEGYLETGEYFSKAFEVLKKIIRKEAVLIIGISILYFASGAFNILMPNLPLDLLIGTIGGAFSLLLIRKIAFFIDPAQEIENSSIKLIILAIIFSVPITGIVFLIVFFIFPYFITSYVIEKMTLNELYNHNLKITSGNRGRIFLPIIILIFISYMCFHMCSFILNFLPIMPEVKLVILCILIGISVLFSNTMMTIVYLNVKYIRTENQDYKNRNENDDLKKIE